jgi:hypothetical protein
MLPLHHDRIKLVTGVERATKLITSQLLYHIELHQHLVAEPGFEPGT